MSKENNQDNKPDYKSSETKALDRFTDLMIERLQDIQQDWKKPWFSESAISVPRNLSGRHYNGLNSVMLMLHCEKNNYPLPVFATFDRITGLNFIKQSDGKSLPSVDKEGNRLPHVGVNKGERSFPVMITTYTVVDKETKQKIPYEEFKKLSEEERSRYNTYPKLNVYSVFNVSQTNLKEARPELYAKLEEQCKGQKRTGEQQGEVMPAVDAMIKENGWYCPIKEIQGDEAYYSISRDEIILPTRLQFKDLESFQANLFHEAAHSSGSENRLNRLKPSSFGSSDYAAEELKAELTAAFVSANYGMVKGLKEDSAPYIKNWLDSLHESPDLLKTILMDVKRASSMLIQRIDGISQRIEQGLSPVADEWKQEHESTRNIPVRAEEKAAKAPSNNFGSYQIPEWSLPYIVNGDASGITDKEKEIVDKFLEEKFPDGFIPELEEGTQKELDLYPAFGERNEKALTNRGESPYLAVDTVSVKFSSPGYFEGRTEEKDNYATEVVVDNRKSEEIAAKSPANIAKSDNEEAKDQQAITEQQEEEAVSRPRFRR